MARRNLIRQSSFPYHVYIRSNNKDWFRIPLYQMWELTLESLSYAQSKSPVDLHCFVLMSNHYHLLLTTPNSDIDKFMQNFNRNLSNRIKRISGAENHKFANRYKWTIVDSKNYLWNIYRYIYQNPIRAKLCKICIDYPYSSLRLSPMQRMKLNFKVHISYFKNREFMENVFCAETVSVIKKSLKKERFELSQKDRKFVRMKLKEWPK